MSGRKKYSTELKLEIVERYLKGDIGIKKLAEEYHVSSGDIQKWRDAYEEHGMDGLNTKHGTYTGDFKVSVVEYMHNTGASIRKTAAHFNIPSFGTVSQWERIYYERGKDAMYQEQRGRTPKMGTKQPRKPKADIKTNEVLFWNRKKVRERMNEMAVIKHNGINVITTALLAEVYETDPNNIKTNFNRNKDNFVEGKHYFLLQGAELADFKRLVTDSNPALADNLKFAPQLYLWTERGANRHCKILDTDKAWEQFDNLEETYFKVREVVNTELSPELQMLQGLLSQMVQKELADKERDKKIAKAQEIAQKAVFITCFRYVQWGDCQL